jgi:hypothetical protein
MELAGKKLGMAIFYWLDFRFRGNDRIGCFAIGSDYI